MSNITHSTSLSSQNIHVENDTNINATVTVTNTTNTTNTDTAVTDAAHNERPTPTGDQLNEEQSRLTKMFEKAVVNSPKLSGLDGKTLQSLKADVKRPFFHGIAYDSMVRAAKNFDKASQAIYGIPSDSLKDVDILAKDKKGQYTHEIGKKIDAFTQAQAKLTEKILAFQSAAKNESPILVSTIQSTQARVGEVLNFIASIQMKESQPANPLSDPSANTKPFPNISANTLGEGAQSIAKHMHGSQMILEDLSQEAEDLFEELDTLEGNQTILSSRDFEATITSLQEKVETLRHSIQDAMNPTAIPYQEDEIGIEGDEGIGEATIIADKASFEALNNLLERAETRLQSLATANPLEGVLTAAQAIIPQVPKDVVDKLNIQLKDFPDFSQSTFNKAVIKPLQDYNNQVNSLINGIKSGSVHPHNLRFHFLDLYHNLEQQVEPALLNISDKIQNLKKSITDINDPAYLFCTLTEEKFKDLSSFVLPLALSEKYYESEVASIDKMLRGLYTPPAHTRAEYIHAAFEHNINIGLILEASLRKLPIDQLELTASDTILKEAKELGKGAANTVSLCTYRGADDEDMIKVFKPEVGARRGLEHLRLSQLGYAHQIRVMQLNIASHRVAEMIGCGGTIAQSSIGMHNGQIGLFMEKATGKTAAQLHKSQNTCFVKQDGTALNYQATIQYAQQLGTFDTLRQNLIRELNKLEWADALSGQADRHGDNYLVDLNPETGAVKITGIDNDGSFSSRKVGLTSVDVSSSLRNGLNIRQIDSQYVRNLRRSGAMARQSTIIDFEKDAQHSTLYWKLFGFNQIHKPAMIDRETYTKLMECDLVQYEKKLLSYMDRGAAKAATSRLESAQRHAAELERNGCVVDDWSSPKVLTDLRNEKYSTAGYNPQAKRFMCRDFAELI